MNNENRFLTGAANDRSTALFLFATSMPAPPNASLLANFHEETTADKSLFVVRRHGKAGELIGFGVTQIGIVTQHPLDFAS